MLRENGFIVRLGWCHEESEVDPGAVCVPWF